jgi:hypothetical protein
MIRAERIKSLAGLGVLTCLAVELFRSPTSGSHVVAYELILCHGSALSAVRADDLRRLGAHMASWGEVDTFAGIAGRAWRNGQISDKTVAGWTRSSNRWWRRAALVSTVPLNVKAQGGHGDPDRTLAVCSALIDRSRQDGGQGSVVGAPSAVRARTGLGPRVSEAKRGAPGAPRRTGGYQQARDRPKDTRAGRVVREPIERRGHLETVVVHDQEEEWFDALVIMALRSERD